MGLTFREGLIKTLHLVKDVLTFWHLWSLALREGLLKTLHLVKDILTFWLLWGLALREGPIKNLAFGKGRPHILAPMGFRPNPHVSQIWLL